MRQHVYIETTIPSFYFETQPEPEMVARRNRTRDGWDNERTKYELVTSIAVFEELESGNYPNKNDLPVLLIDEDIEEIVGTYISRYVMPKNPKGDALHLALASQY